MRCHGIEWVEVGGVSYVALPTDYPDLPDRYVRDH